MAQDFATYDPSQLTISAFGFLVQGFAEGTGVRVANASDAFNDKVGMDSFVVRGKSMDRRGDVSFILMSSSSSNALLSAVHNLDLEAPNGAGVGPIYIRDRQGLTLYEAAKCWIVKAPDAEFSNEETPREWKIRCAKLNRLDSGR